MSFFQFRAATWLVAVAMIVCTASAAQAQDSAPSWIDEPIELSDRNPRPERDVITRRVQLDNRPVLVEDSDEPEGEDPTIVGFDSLFLGGGTRSVTHAGQERSFNSAFGFGGYSIRDRGGELIKDEVWCQFGLHIAGEGAGYESRYFRGNLWSATGGIEMALIDKPEDDGEDRPDWSFTSRFLIGYEDEKGDSRTDGYKMEQHTTFFRITGQFDLYSCFISTGLHRASNGVEVNTGWLPTISLMGDIRQPFHTSRASTARRQGFNDRSSHKDRYSATARVIVYRDAWRQGLVDFGADANFNWYRAAGYVTERDGVTVQSVYGGAFFRAQLTRTVFLYLTAGYEQELSTHRGSLLATVSLEIVGIASSIERSLRGGAGDD